jgi:hypothetical protein
MGRALAFVAIGLVFILFLAFTTGIFPAFWLAIPIAIVTAIVVARRAAPLPALLLGALATFGLVVAVIFPIIVINALQGDFDNTDYCDGFCMTNTEGFVFATFIMLFIAVPTSLAGGVISLIASLLTPRQPRHA